MKRDKGDRLGIGKFKIFSDFTEDEIIKIEELSESLMIKRGQTFITEGEHNHDIFMIKSGKVIVFKKSSDGMTEHRLAILKKGSWIGEMSLIEQDECRSASARAYADSRLIRIHFDRVLHLKSFKSLHRKIIEAIAPDLSKKLRYTNGVVVQSMRNEIESKKKEIESNKARIAIGLFAVNLLAILACYTLSLQGLAEIVKMIGSSTPVTAAVALVLALFTLILIIRSGYPLADFGLTLRNGRRVLVEATLFTIPVLALIGLFKLFIIHSVTQFKGQSFIDPFAFFISSGPNPTGSYLNQLVLYVLLCPVQEFVARGGIQSALQNFIPVTKFHGAKAVFISSLLFAMAHSHLGFEFVLGTFVSGLFWGWMYYRQKSLIGVSISHVLIGVWVLFLLGFRV